MSNRPNSRSRQSGRPSRPSRPETTRPTTPKKSESASTDRAQAPAAAKAAKVSNAAKVSKATVVYDPSAAIDAHGLTKEYGDAVALAPMDLRVGAGERITLIGHNGSGKTTLIRMLAGMLEPSQGSATVGGHELGSIEARSSLAYLSDQPVFYDDLTVWEHLEYIARLHGTDDWEQHAVDLLDTVGLVDRADDLPMTFSRGLRQKAAIAMAFVRPFDVMLVDEPFVGLDRTGRVALLDLFRAAHQEGAALLVATHELSSVADSERVIALSGGIVTYDGTAADADVNALTEGLPSVGRAQA